MSQTCQERTHALQQKGRRGPLPLLANFDVAFYPSLPAGRGDSPVRGSVVIFPAHIARVRLLAENETHELAKPD